MSASQRIARCGIDKLWKNTVDLFRSMDIPVRTIECCSGDLADLKVKSYDVEAWSPRQKKYFEVGSCSNLGDAQARRLGIKVKGEGWKIFCSYIEQYCCCSTSYADCILREQSERRWKHQHSEGASAIYGR